MSQLVKRYPFLVQCSDCGAALRYLWDGDSAEVKPIYYCPNYSCGEYGKRFTLSATTMVKKEIKDEIQQTN